MGKQAGPIFLERTIDDVCFYKMDGKYYVRAKSSLTRKQVLFGKRFRKTMESAGRLARGSRIAAAIYGAIPEEIKAYSMYRVMVGEAVRLIKAGMTDEEASKVLWMKYLAEFEAGYKEENEFVHSNVLTDGGERLLKEYDEAGYRPFLYPQKHVLMETGAGKRVCA
jgi:hypothetical protein